MLTLARAESIDSLAALDDGAPKSAPALPWPAATIAAARAGSFRGPRPRSAALVERMVELVETMPWPARSRELQALLGISKDRFLRVANLALDMKLVRRIGQKGGVKYLPVKKRSA